MPKTQPKKNFQTRRMFGLAKERAALAGLTPHDYLAGVAFAVTRERTSSLAELTFDEANACIVRLGGTAFPAYGHSYRNQKHKEQEAGVKTVETEAHVIAIREAAALRNMGEEGLAKLADRMKLPWPPHTTEQGNKVFEAVKAMNKRDNIVAFPVRTGSSSDRLPTATPSEPAFRRVA